ncbi:putative ATP-dependent DNA helicase [Erwinia phage vB_EamM_Kwan]|uniref:Putative ATP-dependent DNA helicase n=1 Tax=Erwinia phage vB_EamM_Kwan TaxID=1883374 RepID=A0A1B2IDP6_9CAUD|nr:DNA helicase [Erwinia phage vB_EamM_Kwan]ANZ49400.1 putative ATP-dependent DNA helicase [Erwinia phage vB_EamM_Kwan]
MRYTIHITHTSMGIRVEVPVRQMEVAILDWAQANLHAPKMGKDHGRIVTEKGDGFYVHMPTIHTFIFHKTFLNRIQSILNHVGVEYKVDYEIREHHYPRAEPYRCEFANYGFEMVVTDETSRFFYQNEVVDTACSDGQEQTIFAIQTGRGKVARHDVPVRIPGGWKPHGELAVGDQVIGRNGKPTNVTAVFPHENWEFYRITFGDGRSTVVGKEHLWQSFYVNTTEHKRWQVRSTEELKRLISKPNPRVYIPLPEPEETSEKSFPVPPYLLGALIGNGSLSGRSIFFSTNDVETLEAVRAQLPVGYEMKHAGAYDHYLTCNKERSLHLELQDLGLLNTKANQKFIPDIYLEGSIAQRWEILRGLMDTDGTVNKDGGQPSYCTVSRDLALGVQELVRSLGGIAKISEKQPTYTYKGERRLGQTAYIVFIRHKTPSMLFNLPRKKVLCRDDGQYTDTLKLRVTSIEFEGVSHGSCITVDNEDSLYVLGQWIVTHNTKTFQKVMVRKGVRTALIHRASYVDKWKFDCSEDPTGLQEPAEGVHVCKGVEGIYEAYQMGLNGELDAKGIKIIIFSTTSLMMFLKEYINTAHSNAVCLEKFYDVMGVGLVGCDEVHEHFYLVYLAGIMLNPPATVEMSATLTPGASKQFIGERYLERFPMNCRVSVPFIPVVDVRALYYSIENKKLVTYGSKMTPYNHKMLEKAFVKYNAHESFAEMVWDLMVKTYLKNYEVGQKALVFFATVDMCAFFTEFLQRKLAATEWDYLQVFKYNAGDSYDDFIAADIGVSTPGKAGTAIDIPGLMHAYVTIPIDDQQLNEQIAGRPRATTRWPIDPRVWFLHCNDIPKHGTYLSSRKKSLGEKVKSFQIAFSPYVIRSSNASTSYSFASQTPVRRIELSKFSPKRSKGVSRRRRRR